MALSALEETLVLMYQARRAQESVELFRAATTAAIGARQRVVADLYYRGLSLSEIGEVLGTSKRHAQRVVEEAREVYPYRPTATGQLTNTVALMAWGDGSPRSGPSGRG